MELTKTDDNNISFPTKAGVYYTVAMSGNSSVTEIADSEMDITIVDRTAFVKQPEASMKAYDLTGRMLASSKNSTLDLSSLENGTIIIEASINNRKVTRKVIL